jgi:cytoskeleton protein RodZ
MSDSREDRASSGIGARLQAARQRAALTILQAAEKLHVDAQMLEALESERFSELGATVFVRGHIRRYAELVGESAAELQGLYAARAEAERPPDLTQVPRELTTGGSRLRAPGLLGVLAIALIGGAWWIGGTLRAPSPQPSPEAQLSSRTAGVPLAETSVSSGAGAQQGGGVGVAAAAATPAGPPRAVVAGTAVDASAAGPPPVGSVAASGSARPEAATPQKPLALTLHFAQDSWAEVYDARGDKLFYDVGPADSTRTLSGMAPLRIVLGNAPGVALEINGRAVSLPSAGTGDAAAQFRITRSGHVLPAPLAAAEAHHP